MDQWHSLDSSNILLELRTNAERGLDAAEVERRRAEYGRNELTQKKQLGPLIRFLQQFNQPLIYILLFAMVMTGAIGEWVDAGVIFGVVLINGIVGFIQESKAITAIQALARSMQSMATVVRDKRKIEIPSEELVPGDIVLLQAGDKVPADLRLLRARDLQIDESALTGESVAVCKSPEKLSESVTLADRKNMAYAASMVTFGQGAGVVIATGDRSEMGRISEMVESADVLQTPLTRKIEQFSHLLLRFILLLAVSVFVIGMVRGQPLGDTLMAAIALIVSAIPEGLPAAITIMLAIGVSRMARRQAIVRKLPAIETLGSTNIICSDKTGTLTENQMTVRRVYAGGALFDVTGAGYAPTGQVRIAEQPLQADSAPGALRECIRAGVLCNNSVLEQKGDGRWHLQGDPTEGALVVVGHKLGLRGDVEAFERLDEIPFQSEYQYMATLHRDPQSAQTVAYIKGSVEALSDKSTSMIAALEGTEAPFDRQGVDEKVKEMGNQGLRVLAFAKVTLPPEQKQIRHEDVAAGLTFLGLQGMVDPPRAEAKQAIALCQRAGIQVKMITGDHALTALRIAEQLGLPAYRADGTSSVMTGKDLAIISSEELEGIAEGTTVFARVSPEQKLKLVRALQGRGHVVAMTGDGVNDAPALQQADIGIAMGLKGTDVAKEASDMVLADDNFASIESAVEEGRNVFDNLTKFIVWTLPTNLGESLVILVAIGLGVALPVLPVQILWINMTTAVLLGLMLAFEPKEPDVMERPPRHRDDPILNRDLIMRTLFVGTYIMFAAFLIFDWEHRRGLGEAYARTAVVNAIVLIELFYLFNCRSLLNPVSHQGYFTNPWVWVGSGLMILAQIVLLYVPVMNTLFGTRPLDLLSWAVVLASGLLLFTLVNIEKRIRLHFAKRKKAQP